MSNYEQGDNAPNGAGEAEPKNIMSLMLNRFRQMRTERIDHDLLKHFATSIESDIDINRTSDPSASENEKTVVDTIRRKLSEISPANPTEINWSHAYHAEKLLLAIFSNDRVRVELLRRVDRLSRTDAPFASFYREAIVQIDDPNRKNDTEPEVARRNLLISMVDDVQLYNCRRYIKMRYARSAIYRIGSVFVLAFLVFLFALTWGHWETNEKNAVVSQNAPFKSYSDHS